MEHTRGGREAQLKFDLLHVFLRLARPQSPRDIHPE